MVVEKMNDYTGITEAVRQLADAAGLPGVDNDQTADFGEFDVFDFFELIDVAKFLSQIVTDAFFLRTGKNQLGGRIESFGGDHGSQAVKISANMGGYDVHGRDYTRLVRSVKGREVRRMGKSKARKK